ncbi:CRISPR-associated endonuclease Cas9 [uncultured Gammaproteobacteria bacterium]|nr:CRISPR-associated endonuclease Cas9 [uncultured Gammaproteobacteria bacterium]
MSKKILGLDLGSNSIGWALMNETDGEVEQIIDLGSRIFNKAVEEKVPTPKNQKRRDMRLGRRVLQRRARRKQRMANYLISLDLLPQELSNNFGQEKLLNELGDPYELRTKGLDKQLTPHQLGRVLLHFVARRGFLSSKKQIAGDLVDDPDTQTYLSTLDNKKTKDEEGQFKADIAEVYQAIKDNNARTLGEYLFNFETGKVKRNRSHDGGHLRTDRAMYKDELYKIWEKQQSYFDLPDEFISEVEKIIFYQRPLKLKKDRVGKCSLELKHYRANTARLEVQRFRYLQDVNNLEYFERHSEQWFKLNDKQKDKLKIYFEYHSKITITALKKELGLDKPTKINLEAKNLKGNITACEIRNVIGNSWDEYSDEKQSQLFEDLFTIKKKSSLKARLITHWDFNKQTAVKLCLIEFEPSHSNISLKAIKKLLPFLEKGLIYSKKDTDTGELGALQAAGYQEENKESEVLDKLPKPPKTSNPIVNKGLHELRRVVNAVIKQYGKLDVVRIEMARDLEMNTKRYKDNEIQQRKNQKSNEEATKVFAQETGRKFPSHDEKIRYRLWKDQDGCCAYSGNTVALGQIFSAECEIDHILPFKKSLDDSYMNKVLCFEKENRNKADRTPIDAWGGDNEKWNQITQAISNWKYLDSKVKRFYIKEEELGKRDFISNQLNDTRYISCLAQDYMRELGCDVSVTKGIVVAKIRYQWGFNNLIGKIDKKERTDHRHHAIDAVVIASTSRSLYQNASRQIKQDGKLKIPKPYNDIFQEIDEKLKHMIVSHTPQRKLSGALHEETGAGYVAKHGGLVYRKTLNSEFTTKNAMSIVDEQVKNIILEHISNYKDTKEAFNEENLQTLKLGKNPIKRVRVLQSKIKTTKKQTAEDILQQTKFGVKDKSGKIFKYMSYGNTHHVEIIQNIKTGKIKGEFVTMMQASHRAKGINMSKQPIIKTDHGDEWDFLMALHINDTVSVEKKDGQRVFYRVQKMGIISGKLTLRLNTTSTIDNKNEEVEASISTIFEQNAIKLHKVNAIGGLIDD